MKMSEKKKRRILLASDTHGRNAYLETILRTRDFDGLVFCGDGEGLENELDFMPGCPADISMVRGNNDYNTALLNDAVLNIAGVKAFLTHGHRYRLYEGFESLCLAADSNECRICLFGHIHRPVCAVYGGVLFINPGSLSEPRQEDRVPTCAVLETEETMLNVRFINGRTLEDYDPAGTEGGGFKFEF